MLNVIFKQYLAVHVLYITNEHRIRCFQNSFWLCRVCMSWLSMISRQFEWVRWVWPSTIPSYNHPSRSTSLMTLGWNKVHFWTNDQKYLGLFCGRVSRWMSWQKRAKKLKNFLVLVMCPHVFLKNNSRPFLGPWHCWHNNTKSGLHNHWKLFVNI